MLQNLFTKKDLPNILPKSLQQQVDLVSKTKTKNDAIKLAYDIVTSKYHGHRAKTYLHLKKLLNTDIDKIWSQSGFYQCTAQNYLIRLLLVNCGKFTDKEIEQKFALIWYIGPHQYLKIHLDNNEVTYIDPWSKIYGVAYGQYAHGFKSGRITKVK